MCKKCDDQERGDLQDFLVRAGVLRPFDDNMETDLVKLRAMKHRYNSQGVQPNRRLTHVE